MVTGLLYTHDPNFGCLSSFWRCKEHPYPLSPHLVLWRTLEVPVWGLASWSWFIYGHWSLPLPWSEFWLYLDFEGAKNMHVLYVLIWVFGECWMWLTEIWHLYFDLDIVSGPWYTHVLNFGSILILKVHRISMSAKSWFGFLTWFWRYKVYPCHLSPDLGIWRMLEISNRGLTS